MNKIIRGRFSPLSVPTLQKDDGTFTSSDEETAQYLLKNGFQMIAHQMEMRATSFTSSGSLFI